MQEKTPMKLLLTASAILFLGFSSASAQQVTGLSNWSLYLDPGHSQTENMGVNNYTEPQKVLRVALYAKAMLEQQTDIDTVYICRTNDMQQVSLAQRTDDANSKAADFYHSIHSNAGAPATNNVLTLWGAWYQDGNSSKPLVEKTPNGGKKMGDIFITDMMNGMRLPSNGSWGDRSFYQSGLGNTWPYLHVNRESNMASTLTEGGYHTNPTQNSKNMNAEYKKLEAQTHFWSYLRFHNLPRPKVGIVTGIISDFDSGVPINGAVATIGVQEYTTDTFESLFKKYVSNPDLLHNGFYYLEDVPTHEPIQVIFRAPGYYNDTLNVATLNDTTFNFNDIKLVSSVKPYVVSLSPDSNSAAVEPTQSIVIQFSRKMNRASVESAFSIQPSVAGNFVWSSDTKVSFVPNANLLFETSYTVTIAETAMDQFGHLFDGNNDGVTGDGLTFSFTTTLTDLQAPAISSIIPTNTDESVDPLSPINITFSELVRSGLSSSSFKVNNLTTDEAVTVKIKKNDINGKTVMTLFATSPFIASNEYEVIVEPGLGDKYGNTTTEQTKSYFTVSSVQNAPVVIDSFESGIELNWWAPQQSGSTIGIITDSTSRASESTIVSAYANSKTAMKVRYGWDKTVESHLIRQYLGGGTPLAARFNASHTLQANVFGDGNGNLLRFVVKDASSQLEASPWYTVDWIGWKLIQWKMADGAIPWVGSADGVVNGSASFDSFQLSYSETSSNNVGFYVIDDFSYSAVTTVAIDDDLSQKPTATTLNQNYPNPFNPSTSITFSLAKSGKAQLSVFDVLGRKVATLLNQTLSAGSHSVQFDASALSSGMYLYRLEVGGEIFTHKMTLVK